MKEIIDAKIYDTDTAKLIAVGDNGLDYGDGWRATEELYLTKKGKYFIVDSNNHIVVISDDLKIGNDQYRYLNETGTVHEWLHDWNVSELESREIKAFGIVDA